MPFTGSHLPYLSEPKFPTRERSKADRKLLKNGLIGFVGKHVPLLSGLCKLSDTFGQSWKEKDGGPLLIPSGHLISYFPKHNHRKG